MFLVPSRTHNLNWFVNLLPEINYHRSPLHLSIIQPAPCVYFVLLHNPFYQTLFWLILLKRNVIKKWPLVDFSIHNNTFWAVIQVLAKLAILFFDLFYPSCSLFWIIEGVLSFLVSWGHVMCHWPQPPCSLEYVVANLITSVLEFQDICFLSHCMHLYLI